jgi:hypothetical protein
MTGKVLVCMEQNGKAGVEQGAQGRQIVFSV